LIADKAVVGKSGLAKARRRRKAFFAMVSASLLVVLWGCKKLQSTPWSKPATTTIGCADYLSQTDGANVYNNNVWNKGAADDAHWTQCLERHPSDGSMGWSWSWPQRENVIFGYPQVKRGTSPWAPLPNVPSGLPVAHSALRSLRISHALDIVTNGDHNVATSMWLTNTSDIGNKPNPSVILAELMVWTYATPAHMKPAGSKAAEVEVDGQQWEVWVDKNWHDASGANKNHWIYLTFLAKHFSLNASFDVVKLTQYAVTQKILPPEVFYADIELGTELMSGAGLAWVKRFDVQVETRSIVASPASTHPTQTAALSHSSNPPANSPSRKQT
jgi:hypothetical protein